MDEPEADTACAPRTSEYGQYCPLALAAELLCRRWTLLVASRVLDGCRTFSEIHRGVPRISPTLLSTRLGELERAGIIRRVPIEGSRRVRYEPTEAGFELNDVIMGMAVWGQRWGREMVDDDLDPAFLAWSMSTRLDTSAMPAGRTVIEFEFSGCPHEYGRVWLIHENGKVDMCLKHPGFDTDVLVKADIRRFVETWRGFRDLREEIGAGHVVLQGSPAQTRALPDWLLLSSLAPHTRGAD
ncbi:MAG: helix-turn-helix domain-containing protein [Pseudomonadota bacterium]